MRWDIFCKVIDNWGDAGVCWRLACDLAGRGDAVRLWIDDPAPLAWMAPEGCAGVETVDWRDAGAAARALAGAPADALIEAFGCDPHPDAVARFAQQQHGAAPRPWINLEYLSAEPYVERLHGLPSPVLKGPGAGLTKHFFYPGFSAATGGLLREPGLPQRRAAFDRSHCLARLGIDQAAGERLVTLFCYDPAPALPALLAQIEQAAEPTRLLVTPGHSARALPAGADRRGALALQRLGLMSQHDFDALLWSCDLNLVRGEDSLVRALWAGAPLVWQIYPQDDDVHHAKLDAFLDWLDAPASLRAFHRAWNGIDAGPLPALHAVRLAEWRAVVRAARERLLQQDDLVTRLKRFIAAKRLK